MLRMVYIIWTVGGDACELKPSLINRTDSQYGIVYVELCVLII
jgi:hypothetical protein